MVTHLESNKVNCGEAVKNLSPHGDCHCLIATMHPHLEKTCHEHKEQWCTRKGNMCGSNWSNPKLLMWVQARGDTSGTPDKTTGSEAVKKLTSLIKQLDSLLPYLSLAVSAVNLLNAGMGLWARPSQCALPDAPIAIQFPG